MQNSQQPIFLKILPFVPWAERVFIIAALIALALKATGNTSTTLLVISLGGLAATFFLSGFIPLDIPYDENEKLGFIDLLALTIMPKVAWIGIAISVLGILFHQLGLPPDRYLQMFMIGSSVLVGTVVILLIALAQGVKRLHYVVPIYYRVIPVLLVMAYLFYNQ